MPKNFVLGGAECGKGRGGSSQKFNFLNMVKLKGYIVAHEYTEILPYNQTGALWIGQRVNYNQAST